MLLGGAFLMQLHVVVLFAALIIYMVMSNQPKYALGLLGVLGVVSWFGGVRVVDLALLAVTCAISAVLFSRVVDRQNRGAVFSGAIAMALVYMIVLQASARAINWEIASWHAVLIVFLILVIHRLPRFNEGRLRRI